MCRLLLLIASLAIMVGCSMQPLPILAMPAQAGSPVVATLADANNPVEMAATPVVTRLAIYTKSVARALKRGQISKEYAITCRERERVLRKQLETAIAESSFSAISDVSNLITVYAGELPK